MRSAEDIKILIKKLNDKTSAKMDERVLKDVVCALEETEKTSALIKPMIRSKIMKNPIIKLAVAAIIIVVVILGLVELIDTDSKSGLVWAEVAQKVNAAPCVIYRTRSIRSWKSEEPDYTINHRSITHSRHDVYQADKIIKTFYDDYNTKTVILVDHNHKSYVKMTFEDMEQNDLWTDPKSMVQKFLSHEHRELGKKNIEGVLCEGIETTDPDFFGPDPLLDNLTARVWASLETGYPVKFEVEIVRKNGEIRIEEVADQFQWNVELDETMLEPDIPTSYIDISP